MVRVLEMLGGDPFVNRARHDRARFLNRIKCAFFDKPVRL